ncbi:MAG: YdcF family protein [Cyanobium sp.]
MFVLYKMFGQLVMPLALGLMVALAATCRWPARPVRPLLLAVLAGLWLLSLPVVARQLMRLVDDRVPVTPEARLPQADAVVVLSGGFPERELCGLHLRHSGKAPVVLFSGRMFEGDVLRLRQLLAMTGLGAEQLRFEQASRTTSEGGVAFAALAAREGWRRVLLVSSAYHLPRALARYRTPGIEVIGAVCPELRLPDRAMMSRRPLEEKVSDWIPTAEGLRGSTTAIRELLGLLVPRRR